MRGPQGPAPLCSVPAHCGVSFSPLGFPPPTPPEQHPSLQGSPCLIAETGALAFLPYCSGLRGFPPPGVHLPQRPLPLVAHNEGGSGALPHQRPLLGGDTPHCGGFQVPHCGGVSGLSASRSAPPSPPSGHFAEAGGRGEQLQYRGRGRGPSIRAAAPLIGRRRPPRGRGHMRRRRRRRAPQTLCGRADCRTHARTEARALQRPPARARA